MIRSSLIAGVLVALCSACSSSSDATPPGGSSGAAGASDEAAGGSASAAGTGNSSCPDVSGAWEVTAHCEPSIIGMTLQVTQNACALSFAVPFDEFIGNVTAGGMITLSGPQSCTGTASASAIAMSCTPTPCPVKLAR